MNLDALRQKRIKRLGVKATAYSGQRRIYFILDRATKKFHGDIGLWMQYIDYARKQKSNKKLLQVLSTVLRLHPNKPDLWIYAAKYATDIQADVTGARTYLQRGLRFCRSSKELWLEYAKLEMIYIAKIVGRRRILGLDEPQLEKRQKTQSITDKEFDADMIALSTDMLEDEEPAPENPQDEGSTDHLTSQDLDTSPVLNGAIPQAVFKAAMKQFPRDEVLAYRFFDLFSGFVDVPCSSYLHQHVLDYLIAIAPTGSYSLSCYIRQPIIGVDANSPEFAAALRSSLGRLKTSLETTSRPGNLAEHAIDWLTTSLRLSNIDEGIQKALLLTLRRTIHQFKEVTQLEHSPRERKEIVEKLVRKLNDLGCHEEAMTLSMTVLEK